MGGMVFTDGNSHRYPISAQRPRTLYLPGHNYKGRAKLQVDGGWCMTASSGGKPLPERTSTGRQLTQDCTVEAFTVRAKLERCSACRMTTQPNIALRTQTSLGQPGSECPMGIGIYPMQLVTFLCFDKYQAPVDPLVPARS